MPARRGVWAGRAHLLKKHGYWFWKNLCGAVRARIDLRRNRGVVADLNRYERRVRSQNGEDGILEALFRVLGTTNRRFVELGAGHGRRCITAHWKRNRGWTGLMVDGARTARSEPDLQQAFVTAENVEALLAEHDTPERIDLLCIDIDGNDYWVWRAIEAYRARVVVIEYNAAVSPTEARVLPYDPDFVWDGTDYFGASLLALARLGEAKGYRLVACDSSGTNAFFVEEASALGLFPLRSPAELYKPPAFRGGAGHPQSRRRLPPLPADASEARTG